jgi:hypothetical protein
MENTKLTNIEVVKNLAPKLSYPERLHLCSLLLSDDIYSDKEDIILNPIVHEIVFNIEDMKTHLNEFHHFLISYLQENVFSQIKLFLPIYQNQLDLEGFNQKCEELFNTVDYYSYTSENIIDLFPFSHLFNEKLIKKFIFDADDSCFAIEKLTTEANRANYINTNFITSFSQKYRTQQQQGIYYLAKNNIVLNDALKESLFSDLITYRCQKLIKNLFGKKEIAKILSKEFNYFLMSAIRKMYYSPVKDNLILKLIKNNIAQKQLIDNLKGFIITKKNQRSILNDCMDMDYVDFKNFKHVYEFFKDEIKIMKINPYEQLVNFYQLYPKKVKSVISDKNYYESDYSDTEEDIKNLTEEMFTQELSEFEMLSLNTQFNSTNNTVEKTKKSNKI